MAYGWTKFDKNFDVKIPEKIHESSIQYEMLFGRQKRDSNSECIS